MNRLRCPAFAVACLAFTAQSALAGGPFDGHWSVSIWTKRGDCDPGYKYEVLINDGRLANGGPENFDISGRIDPNGAVKVSVRRGEQHASGAGKLAAGRGAGTWQGKSTTGECAGTWEAERR
jgi:hypothetical protein